MTPDQANTTVSDEDLLPCPFCGGKARMEYYASTAVECTSCPVTMDGLFSSPELALAAWNRRATADVTEATHRHVKRGTEYVLMGMGKMQAEGWRSIRRTGEKDGYGFPIGDLQAVDMAEVAIYRSVDDGSLWVRPREEFDDGRFAAINPPMGR